MADKAATFVDPLDTPAIQEANLTSEPMLSVAKAGSRIVAVGLRGLIVISQDGGETWQQADCPVQADLTSVFFLNAQRGWIVGHGGVILGSDDGGRTWRKLFDGRQETKFVKIYRRRVDQGHTDANQYLRVMQKNTHFGPQLPFNDIWFRNDAEGYTVGPFGMLVKTSDGGNTWQPWLSHIDNQQFFHLNTITRIGENVFVAGERGRIYRFDARAQYFSKMSSNYDGSFFGIIGTESALVAYGLQGTVRRSTDGGQTWESVAAGLGATATAGKVLSDGRYLILSEEGEAVVSSDQGASFSPFPISYPMIFSDVTEVRNTLVFVGLRGIQTQALR